jgi:large subunit ribosomal protein L4
MDIKNFGINVLDFNSGEVVDFVTLEKKLFDIEWNPVLFKEVYDYYRDQQRQCTYSTKHFSENNNRGEISGSGKKVRQQKGLGKARVHTLLAPQFRGGVVAFGPNGRNYQYSIPKKKKHKVLWMVISRMFTEKKIIVVKELEVLSSKTRGFIRIADDLKVNKALMVSKNMNHKLFLAQRNIKNFDLINVERVNIINLLKYQTLILDQEALLYLENKGVQNVK